jgi:hypothetical protein
MSKLVPDTNAELRSLLADCQAADDPLPALANLAYWLDARGDPRGAVVRTQARYWYVYYCRDGFDQHYAAEAKDLQERSDRSQHIYEEWLGFQSNGDIIGIARQMPLLDLQVRDVERARPHLAKLREVLQAGWVWDMYILGIAVDEIMAELLSDCGPLRQICFGKDAAKALRDIDLKLLQQVPYLRTLVLSGTRVSDAGLRHLNKIRSLRSVELEGTRVTSGGVSALSKALPDCVFLGLK